MTLGEMKPDNLIASTTIPILPAEITVKTGQGTLKKGSVLGRITASKTCLLVDSASTDGSEEPYCILTDDVDTSGGDVITTGYFSGVFHSDELIFGGTDTAEDHEKKLRDLNIYLK